MKKFTTTLVRNMSLTLMIFCFYGLNAQTYATPELKERAEKEHAEKMNRLGIKEEARPAINAEEEVLFSKPEAQKLKIALKKSPHYKLISINATVDQRKISSFTEAELALFQDEAYLEFDKIDVIIDWTNKIAYTINKNTGHVSQNDVSDVDFNQTKFENRALKTKSSFTISRLCADSFVVRYPYADDHTGAVYFDFLFEKGKTN